MSALSPRQAFLLDMACQPLREAFPDYGPYLVGTAQGYQKGDPAPRDVDVRCIVQDDIYDVMVDALGIKAVRFLCLALGQYIASLTGLPIDFQFQRMTEANDGRFPAHGGRQPLGMGDMGNFVGDAERSIWDAATSCSHCGSALPHTGTGWKESGACRDNDERNSWDAEETNDD